MTAHDIALENERQDHWRQGSQDPARHHAGDVDRVSSDKLGNRQWGCLGCQRACEDQGVEELVPRQRKTIMVVETNPGTKIRTTTLNIVHPIRAFMTSQPVNGSWRMMEISYTNSVKAIHSPFI